MAGVHFLGRLCSFSGLVPFWGLDFGWQSTGPLVNDRVSSGADERTSAFDRSCDLEPGLGRK